MKVLITGGSGDIAQAIKIQLSNSDYDIYTPSSKELNVQDREQVYNYINKIKPDILINNAGFIKQTNLDDNSFLFDEKTIDINLTSVFFLTMTALEVNNNIKVVNIGSSAGTKARGGWASYCASKAGLIMATKCWADENIDVVCLSPGRTISKMRAELFPDEDQSSLMRAEDFAKVVKIALTNKFEPGSNIDVNINNVMEIINE